MGKKDELIKKINIMIRSSFWISILMRMFRGEKYQAIKEKAKAIKYFQKKYNIDTFIETGTYLGETIKGIRNDFRNIYSIELDRLLFENARKQFTSYPKIRIFQGDSARVLPEILRLIKGRALFWLDAHTSGGITARGDKVTPVMEELLAIEKHPIKNHIILIDDAESFVGANDYPVVSEIDNLFRGINSDYKVEIKDNIIRIFP